MTDALNMINTIIVWLRILLKTAVILGLVCGFMLLFSKKLFGKINDMLNTWISTEIIEKFFGSVKNVDQYVLSRNRIFGILLIMISILALVIIKSF